MVRISISLGIGCIAILMLVASLGCVALGAGEKPVVELHNRGMRAYANEDYALAALLLEKVVERVPGDAEAWFRLGNSYSRTGRPRQAVIAFQQAVQKKSSHERAWYNLGVTQTRIAANSFIEMSKHLDENDPLRGVALDMAEALLDLLSHRGRLPTTAEAEAAARGNGSPSEQSDLALPSSSSSSISTSNTPITAAAPATAVTPAATKKASVEAVENARYPDAHEVVPVVPRGDVKAGGESESRPNRETEPPAEPASEAAQ